MLYARKHLCSKPFDAATHVRCVAADSTHTHTNTHTCTHTHTHTHTHIHARTGVRVRRDPRMWLE
jgi:hypothetical protein